MKYDWAEIYEEMVEAHLLDKFKGNKTMNRQVVHNILTFGFWACIVVIGVLQALGGQGVGDFTAIIGILGTLEHILAGKLS
jgi:hypothetical protein